jgi:DNA polymerase III subunit delta'
MHPTISSDSTVAHTHHSLALVNEIRGHNFVLATIQRAFDNDRLHHAYLFHGPSGVGKCRTAVVIARLLLCSTPNRSPSTGHQSISTNACGRCKSCQRITPLLNHHEGTYHPDLHYISRDTDSNGKVAKEIKIAPIRKLQSALSLGAFEGGRSVVIIEEVDRLGLSAANALLKTLEEPLPNVHFLLTTDSLNAVLPTIKSRAQSLRFAALNMSILDDLLKISERSQPDQSPSSSDQRQYSPLTDLQRQSLAQLSGGSIGRALSMWSQGGMGRVEHLIQKSDLSGGPQDFLNALEFSKSFENAQDSEIALWLHLLRCWYRDALVLLHTSQETQLFFPNFTDITLQRGQRLGVKRLMWRLQALDEGEKHLLKRTGSNKKLIMETLCLYLAGFDLITQKPLVLS